MKGENGGTFLNATQPDSVSLDLSIGISSRKHNKESNYFQHFFFVREKFFKLEDVVGWCLLYYLFLIAACFSICYLLQHVSVFVTYRSIYLTRGCAPAGCVKRVSVTVFVTYCSMFQYLLLIAACFSICYLWQHVSVFVTLLQHVSVFVTYGSMFQYLLLIAACDTRLCPSGMCDKGRCCDKNCIGGCTGPSNRDCVACRNVMVFNNNRTFCAEKCLPGTYEVSFPEI